MKGRVALDKWKDTSFSKMLPQDVTVKIKEVAAGFPITVSIFSGIRTSHGLLRVRGTRCVRVWAGGGDLGRAVGC